MQSDSTAAQDKATGAVGRLVAKNTAYLAISQALTIPLAVVMNAAMARYLGPEEFGFIYLASTVAGFGFLAVNWGHEGALPALVAQSKSEAGALLGSSIAWRLLSSLFVYAVLALTCQLLHYPSQVQWALALICLASVFTACLAGLKDTVRGFERMDVPAYTHVAQQFLMLSVVPVLLLGGRMRSALLTQALAPLIVLFFAWRTLKGVGIQRVFATRAAMKALFIGGSPFVVFGIAMALQPNIDALYLSKLAPTEVMGWYAVSRRLLGVLVFPASALIGALYPTLCRLHVEDKASFVEVSRGSLLNITLLVVPVALGCGLYPEIGITIFSRESFGPAEDNLRILSAYLFLMYFSMPLGTCILAAGKQRAWSLVQALCVVVSLVLDPLLVPLFQQRTGNGGLGLCAASVAAEVLVIAFGVVLAPKGIFNKRLGRAMLLSLLAGVAMIAVARLTHSVTPFVSAPLALVAYGATLYFSGGIEKQQLAAIQGFVLRKLRK